MATPKRHPSGCGAKQAKKKSTGRITKGFKNAMKFVNTVDKEIYGK